MIDPVTALITWTTYGTWLPGDQRGWRKRNSGEQFPQPRLEHWSRRQMAGEAVLLDALSQSTVEQACRDHCQFRRWQLLAVNVRTNHVHVVVAAPERPQTVRDQLKANCTRRLRQQTEPLICQRTWTRGGDCTILNSEQDVENAVIYVTAAQDRKGRDAMSTTPARTAEFADKDKDENTRR